jgi:hypothetical protein
VSKHDSVTKRKRRPKSDKRVDYSARTMAALRELEKAAKLRESSKPISQTVNFNQVSSRSA